MAGERKKARRHFYFKQKILLKHQKAIECSSVETVYLFKGLEILRLISRRALLIIARLGRVHVPWLVPGIEQIDTFLFS